MSTDKEKSKQSQYIFVHEEKSSKVITYKTNLVKELQEDKNAKDIKKIQDFDTKNVTDYRFEDFIKIAKDAGYKIYSVREL